MTWTVEDEAKFQADLKVREQNKEAIALAQTVAGLREIADRLEAGAVKFFYEVNIEYLRRAEFGCYPSVPYAKRISLTIPMGLTNDE